MAQKAEAIDFYFKNGFSATLFQFRGVSKKNLSDWIQNEEKICALAKESPTKSTKKEVVSSVLLEMKKRRSQIG